MPSVASENYFKKGLTALVDQNHEDATVYFRRALEVDRERDRNRTDLRYLSYYGLSLARAGHSTTLALEACRKAVSRRTTDPLLYLNLGRVCLIAGRTSQALEAFERGLALAPDHRILRREIERIDRRSAPVVGLFGRDHALNRALGRVRSSWRSRRAAPRGTEAVVR